MRSLTRNVCLSLFAACIVTTAAHGSSKTIPVGGTGGGPFSILCPKHQVLVGLSMRLGSAMDAIGPVCAHLKKDGSTPRPTTVPRFTGGTGGSGQSIACKFDHFVHSMKVFVDKFEIVNHVEINCRSLKKSDPGKAWHIPPHGGQSARNYEVYCQVNHIPNGIHGNSGSLIDRVGLLCDLPDLIVTQ